jgi:hypothetical protein
MRIGVDAEMLENSLTETTTIRMYLVIYARESQ